MKVASCQTLGRHGSGFVSIGIIGKGLKLTSAILVVVNDLELQIVFVDPSIDLNGATTPFYRYREVVNFRHFHSATVRNLCGKVNINKKPLILMVEAAGVEPASLAKLPAATTCLVRREFSTGRLRPDTESHSPARMVRVSARHAQTPRLT